MHAADRDHVIVLPQPVHGHGLKIDPVQRYRAIEIKLWSVKRPYMRAFHVAWVSFFFAFVAWFAFTPLLNDIQDSLGLSYRQVWVSTVLTMAAPVPGRLIFGPLVDAFGPTVAQSLLLIGVAFPLALGGLVDSAVSLCVVRFIIGMVGTSFVCSQAWTSTLFGSQVVGTANATVAGWGNLGGGVSIILMHLLNQRLRGTKLGSDSWRASLVVPGVLVLGLGLIIPFITDDGPFGNLNKLVSQGKIQRTVVRKAAAHGFSDFNSWILFVMYAASFGVELHMNNSTAAYFEDRFNTSPGKATWVTALFGFTNLFARSAGGALSDWAAHKRGLSGRMWVHGIVLFFQGALMVGFGFAEGFTSALTMLIVMSCFLQAAEGLCYGIVPFVQPLAVGTVSGVVAAGGSMGAVVYALMFTFIESGEGQKWGYIGIGIFTMTSAVVMTPLLNIRGVTLRGSPNLSKSETLAAAIDIPAYSGGPTPYITTLTHKSVDYAEILM